MPTTKDVAAAMTGQPCWRIISLTPALDRWPLRFEFALFRAVIDGDIIPPLTQGEAIKKSPRFPTQAVAKRCRTDPEWQTSRRRRGQLDWG